MQQLVVLLSCFRAFTRSQTPFGNAPPRNSVSLHCSRPLLCAKRSLAEHVPKQSLGTREVVVLVSCFRTFVLSCLHVSYQRPAESFISANWRDFADPFQRLRLFSTCNR